MTIGLLLENAARSLPIEPDRVEELIREGRRFLAAASEYLKGIHENEAPDVPLDPE